MTKTGRSLSWWMAGLFGLCSGSALANPPTILATTGVVGDTVRAIGGECIAAEVLMGPGVDPHLYQASASDVQRFRDAELIVYNGFGLEGQLDNVLQRFAERRPTLALAKAASEAGPRQAIDGGSDYATDPHLWMDAALWSQGIGPLTEALADISPECAALLRARAEQHQARLQALDAWLAESIATIPEPQRVMISAHDAFEYFGRAYELEVRGIQGISTTAEASVADIQDVARLIAERGIPAIFIETTINPRTVEAVLAAAKQRDADVRIGGALYGDALGEPGTLAEDLIGMLIANGITLTEALGGEAPALPAALSPWQARKNAFLEQHD